MDKAISGNYKHFKGYKYTVYCKAVDQFGKEYVLYRQQYGNNSFWIRPYDMFFEKTTVCNDDGTEKTVLRFTPPKKCSDSAEYIKELINLVKKQRIIVRHSENESEYIIANISADDGVVSVQPYSQRDPPVEDDKLYSGLLTEDHHT